MKFFHFQFDGYFPKDKIVVIPTNLEYPCVLLIKDLWDDGSWSTNYTLRYYENPETFYVNSEVKILQIGFRNTQLPPQPFESLYEDYISLGQSAYYYDQLSELPIEINRAILGALNDVLFNDLQVKAENQRGFFKSLLRSSEAEKVYYEGHSLFPLSIQRSRNKVFDFEFTTTLPGADSFHRVNFDFTPNETGLNRTNVIIGKNGTGKTQLLANLANAMSGVEEVENDQFIPRRPSFSKIIAISYSVFDRFVKPDGGSSWLSYKYCGIRETEKVLTDTERYERFQLALKEIAELKREEIFRDILHRIFDDTVDVAGIYSTSVDEQLAAFDKLSSGQSILALVMAQVIAYITTESLILYDEPELYLHPDALTALARAFHKLLDIFNSYAIIATHSPILLQETPSRNVRVFSRYGNSPAVSELGIESFGENLTVITNEVFETETDKNNYREHLRNLIKDGFDEKQINAFFDNNLGFNARTFLLAIQKQPNRGDDEVT